MATTNTTPAHPAAMLVETKAQASSEIPTKTTAESPIPDAIVTTPRLIIRPLHPQDAPSMQIGASGPSIAKYMTLAFPNPYTLEEAKKWIDLNLTPPFYNFTITLSSDPTTCIGGIGLVSRTDVQSHVARLGYWIAEASSGKGYMSEAVDGFVAWVFGEEGIGGKTTKLTGDVFSGHGASMKVLEKAGFLKEGVLRSHVNKQGEIYDLHVYGLLKQEWAERAGKPKEKSEA